MPTDIATQEARRPRRRPGRARRRFWAYSFFILLCAAAALWFVPIRGAWLDDAIERLLEDATKSGVSFTGARCYLGQGLLEINDLSLAPKPSFEASSTSSSAALPLRCQRMEARFNFAGLFLDSPRTVESVSIFEPTPIEIEITSQTVRACGPWESFLGAFQGPRQKSAGPAGKGVRVKEGVVEGLSLLTTVVEPSGTTHKARVDSRAATALFASDGSSVATLDGDRINGRTNRWHARAKRSPYENRITFNASVERAGATLPSIEGRGLRLTVSHPNVSGDLDFDRKSQSKSGVAGKIRVEAARLDLATTDGARIYGEDDFRADVDWSYLPSERSLSVRRMLVEGNGTDLRVEGRLSGDTGLSWEGTLDVFHLPPEPFWWARNQMTLPIDLTFQSDFRWRGEFSALGTLKPLDARLRSAKLTVEGLRVQSPYAPILVKNCALDLSYSPRALVVSELSGQVAGGQFSIRGGRVTGDVLGYEPLNGDFLWTADVDLERMLETSGWERRLEKDGIRLRGRFSAFGYMKQSGRRQADGRWILDEPEVKADVAVTSGYFDHPRLPAPIADINGSLNSHDNGLSVSGLSGYVGRTKVQLSGRIQGERLFWSNPKIDIRLASSVSAADVPQFLPDIARKSVEALRPVGKAEVEGTIRGDVSRLQDLAIAGTIHLSEGGLNPKSGFLQAPITGLDGLLTLDGPAFKIERLEGRLGDIPIECDGAITTDGVALNLNADVDLKSAQRAVPQALRWFDLDGSVTVQARLRLDAFQLQYGASWASDGMDPTAMDLTRFFRRDPRSPKAGEPVLWMLARGEGVRWTPLRMPATMRNLRGEVTFTDGVFSTDNLHGDLGGTPNVAIKAAVAFPEKNRCDFRYDLDAAGEVDLAEWMKPWRRNPRGSQLQLPERWRPPGSEYEGTRRMQDSYVGHIHAPSARWKQYKVQDLVMDVDYHETTDTLSVLEIDATGRTYDGVSTCAFRMPEHKGGGLPWDLLVNCANVDLTKVASVVRQKSANEIKVDGRVSGSLALKGGAPASRPPQGTGEVQLAGSHLVSGAIFPLLAKVLSLGIFDRQSFVTQMDKAGFSIKDNRVWFLGVKMKDEVTQLEAYGSVGFDKTLDVEMTVNFLQGLSFIGKIPVIGPVADFVARFGEPALKMLRVLKARVRGTIDDPRITYSLFQDTPQGLEEIRLDQATRETTDTLTAPPPKPSNAIPRSEKQSDAAGQ